MRSVLAVAMLFAFSTALAADGCGSADPTEFAQQFFKEHRLFYFKETQSLKPNVTSSFYSALQNHYRCAKDGELCHIDYDPWLGAQDGEIIGAVKFSPQSKTNGKTNVTMQYRFGLGSGGPTSLHKVVLQLQATDAPQCWHVSDLITPLGDSLANRYSGQP